GPHAEPVEACTPLMMRSSGDEQTGIRPSDLHADRSSTSSEAPPSGGGTGPASGAFHFTSESCSDFLAWAARRALLDQLGDEECEFQCLIRIEARIAMRVVAVLQIIGRNGPC